MKLIDVLKLLDDDSVPVKDFSDFRPTSSFKVIICFMAEEETWIKTYASHPILLPFYDCEVGAINPHDEYTIQVWLKYQDFLEDISKNKR